MLVLHANWFTQESPVAVYLTSPIRGLSRVSWREICCRYVLKSKYNWDNWVCTHAIKKKEYFVLTKAAKKIIAAACKDHLMSVFCF